MENSDEISPILNALLGEGKYRENITRIRTLYRRGADSGRLF
ncbi:MAG: hypothetical protein VB071_02670 [Lawsonibacter sp.]|nr:hypothetical protein [Lawsonibacter sp.]